MQLISSKITLVFGCYSWLSLGGKALRFFMIFLAIFVAACQSDAPQSYVGPSGVPIQTVKCKSSPTGCFKQAAQICEGKRYKILDSESHAGGLIADVLPGSVTWYGLTFQCGASNGDQPTFPFRGQTYSPPPVVYTPPPIVNNTINSTSPKNVRCNTIGTFTRCTSY